MRSDIEYDKHESDEANLKTFLTWLITPQDDIEQQKLKDSGLIDAYCYLINRIPEMSKEELIKEINNQIEHHDLQIDDSLWLRVQNNN